MPCTVHPPIILYPHFTYTTTTLFHDHSSFSNYSETNINTNIQSYPQHQAAYQQGYNPQPQAIHPQYQPTLYLAEITIARATHNAKHAQDCNWPKAELDPQPLLDGSLDGVSAPPPLVGGNDEPCERCRQNSWALKSCGTEGCGGWVRRCWGCGSLGASGCGHD